MKYTGPKAKRARRHGMNLYGTDKYDKILQRKPYGPGKSPRDTKRGKPSEYSQQLMEKQKARDMYGLSERQFNRYYQIATKVSGQTGEFLKQLLERRLDNVIYRAGFAQTRMQARQFVSHGLFLVDGQRVTIPSFQVRPGEVIMARPASKTSPVFVSILASHEKYLPPNWLQVDGTALKVEIKSLPAPEHAEQAIDMRQIVEFYSRN
jgi:small subunit ribosomal protein S4